MMLSLLVLAVPSMPGVPRSGLPTTMNADLKVAQALRRASGLSEVRSVRKHAWHHLFGRNWHVARGRLAVVI